MNIEYKKKVIVAHPGKQHSFQLATALKKEGILFKYITTVYDKQSFSILKIIKLFLNKNNFKRANSRKCEFLDDDDVSQYYSVLGLIEIFFSRYDKKGYVYRWWHGITSSVFGKKVAKCAIKNNVDAIVLYDTNSKECFKYLKQKAPHIKCIMDVSAANRAYMKTVYEKDMELNKAFVDKLYKEVSFCWDENFLDYYQEEIKLTDYFIVASEFVKRSLEFSGVAKEKIYVCPYGVSLENKYNNKNIRNRSHLSLVYVGNVTAMKGIGYLLEAVKRFPKEKVTLKLIGKFDNSNGLFEPYMDRCDFIGMVTHDKVYDYLSESDVFIFPSLGDGFGLAPAEALSCGLPCIVSQNSGISDFIKDEYNGFVVPVQTVESIQQKIQWFLENLDTIPNMSKNALETAKYLTWERYNNNIIQIIEKICGNCEVNDV